MLHNLVDQSSLGVPNDTLVLKEADMTLSPATETREVLGHALSSPEWVRNNLALGESVGKRDAFNSLNRQRRTTLEKERENGRARAMGCVKN